MGVLFLFGSETVDTRSTNDPSRWIPAIKQMCPKHLDFCAGELGVQFLMRAEIFSSNEAESLSVYQLWYVQGERKGLRLSLGRWMHFFF